MPPWPWPCPRSRRPRRGTRGSRRPTGGRNCAHPTPQCRPAHAASRLATCLAVLRFGTREELAGGCWSWNPSAPAKEPPVCVFFVGFDRLGTMGESLSGARNLLRDRDLGPLVGVMILLSAHFPSSGLLLLQPIRALAQDETGKCWLTRSTIDYAPCLDRCRSSCGVHGTSLSFRLSVPPPPLPPCHPAKLPPIPTRPLLPSSLAAPREVQGDSKQQPPKHRRTLGNLLLLPRSGPARACDLAAVLVVCGAVGVSRRCESALWCSSRGRNDRAGGTLFAAFDAVIFVLYYPSRISIPHLLRGPCRRGCSGADKVYCSVSEFERMVSGFFFSNRRQVGLPLQIDRHDWFC